MPPEPLFSRCGDDLYRTHRVAGRLVAEVWEACAWRAVSDVGFAACKATSVTARVAADVIARRCGPTYARPV